MAKLDQWLWQEPKKPSETQRFEAQKEKRRYIRGCMLKVAGEVCAGAAIYGFSAGLLALNFPLMSATAGTFLFFYMTGSIMQGRARARASFETRELGNYNFRGVMSCIRKQALNPIAL